MTSSPGTGIKGGQDDDQQSTETRECPEWEAFGSPVGWLCMEGTDSCLFWAIVIYRITSDFGSPENSGSGVLLQFNEKNYMSCWCTNSVVIDHNAFSTFEQKKFMLLSWKFQWKRYHIKNPRWWQMSFWWQSFDQSVHGLTKDGRRWNEILRENWE